MIDTLPKITIITVVFNGKDSLLQTINSVSNIGYNNLEYIIIDGGSNDGTQEIIQENESKITYWLSEKDKGIYDAMNKGWAKADSNSYILYLGSGDTIIQLPDMNQYRDIDIIYGNVNLGEKHIFQSEISWRSYFGNTIHHQALLIKKGIHTSPPFSLNYKIYADFDFNQRLMKAGHKFHKDENFRGYALEGGVSEEIAVKESLQVVRDNYGVVVSAIAAVYYKVQKIYGNKKINSSNSSI
ncbi:glycosyltransferase family 2 protein [Pedobacter jejuensis]|uniref:Glycosyltransferase n=1 Tax=Pedobacter jejuensis TaxID=1268550 RepID=A0A3N0C2Y4_9SPHI|nr:glycosyltransferase family 2 protein [Pedobacter jejuensis]RNL56906.1 glycosyltransferase [Pedobacter jejuensis]